jgi:hypothetical protein
MTTTYTVRARNQAGDMLHLHTGCTGAADCQDGGALVFTDETAMQRAVGALRSAYRRTEGRMVRNRIDMFRVRTYQDDHLVGTETVTREAASLWTLDRDRPGSRTSRLVAAMKAGACIVAVAQPYEGEPMAYKPRHPHDARPWVLAKAQDLFRYSAGECRAVHGPHTVAYMLSSPDGVVSVVREHGLTEEEAATRVRLMRRMPLILQAHHYAMDQATYTVWYRYESGDALRPHATHGLAPRVADTLAANLRQRPGKHNVMVVEEWRREPWQGPTRHELEQMDLAVRRTA